MSRPFGTIPKTELLRRVREDATAKTVALRELKVQVDLELELALNGRRGPGVDPKLVLKANAYTKLIEQYVEEAVERRVPMTVIMPLLRTVEDERG